MVTQILRALRHQCIRDAPRLREPQRRWARVHDVRFVATQQAQDRITERYRAKLDRKVKEKGLKDIGELKDAFKDEITDLKKKAAVPGATAPLPPASSADSTKSSQEAWPNAPPPPAQPLDQISPTSPHFKPPGIKTLSSFLDVEKTLALPPKEIESIWRLRHARSSHSLCAAIPTATYDAIARSARRFPQFILPGLPRKTPEGENATADQSQEGAPIHFLQWTFPAPDTVTVIFTHLAEYKLRGEFAQPHTTLTHHLELSQPKGLVLCQGSVIENRGVSIEEGKWLVMCMQKFYNTGEEAEAGEQSDVGKELKKRRRRLMEQFSAGDASFRVEELLEEAERLG